MKDKNILKERLEKRKTSKKTGPLLKLHDLDQKEAMFIAREVFKKIKNNGQHDEMYRQYLLVLTKYGVMCPHPQQKRLYNKEKLVYPSTIHMWYDCEMCGCCVLNESFEKDVDEKKEDIKIIL